MNPFREFRHEARKSRKETLQRVKHMESTRQFRETTTKHSLNCIEKRIAELEDKIVALDSLVDTSKDLIEQAIKVDKEIRQYEILRTPKARSMVFSLFQIKPVSYETYLWDREKYREIGITHENALILFGSDTEFKAKLRWMYALRDGLRNSAYDVRSKLASREEELPILEAALEKNYKWRDDILHILSDAGLEELQKLKDYLKGVKIMLEITV